MTKTAPQAPAPRISAKLRAAMRLHVREGRTITAACQEAGLSRQGWHKAMKRPAVKAELEREKARFVAEVEGSRAIYTAQALGVAADLMRNAKSETVRARMVEFLAGHGQAERQVQEAPYKPPPPPHDGPSYDYGDPPAFAPADDDDEIIYVGSAALGRA